MLFQHIAPAGRSNSEARQRTIAAEISTNQGAPRGHLYVLVFDQDHITSGAEQRVRQAAETFLRRRFTPEDRVAVYGLPGPGPSLPFTRELSAAVAQLKLVRGGLQRTLTPGERDMTVNEAYEVLRGNDAVINRFMTTQGGSDRTGVLPDLGGRVAGGTDLSTTRSLIVDQANLTVQNADAESRRFLDMVSQLLRQFRSVDGRKTVMLFSEGFHTDNISRSIKDVAAAAAETYSVIYSFDLNKRSESLSAVMPTGSDVAPEISNRLESLSQLSADTNGKVILDASTHLDQALDVVGAAELDYYIIGFAAPAAALTNRDEYRHVSVRVTRPGAHVSTRTGYVAGPAQTPADRRRAIDAALRAPFSQQGLRVEYTTYVGQSEHPGFQGVAVSLQTELPVAPAGTDAFADVVFVVNDLKTGQVLANGSDRIALPHQPAPDSAGGQGAWRARFDLPAGEYLMRCVVREPGGLAGSADRQFVVRSLTGPDPAASDLLLGTRDDRLPVHTVGYTDEVLDGAVRVYGRSEAQLAGLTASLDLVSLAATEDDGQHAARTVRGSIGDARGTESGGGPGCLVQHSARRPHSRRLRGACRDSRRGRSAWQTCGGRSRSSSAPVPCRIDRPRRGGRPRAVRVAAATRHSQGQRRQRDRGSGGEEWRGGDSPGGDRSGGRAVDAGARGAGAGCPRPILDAGRPSRASRESTTRTTPAPSSISSRFSMPSRPTRVWRSFLAGRRLAPTIRSPRRRRFEARFSRPNAGAGAPRARGDVPPGESAGPGGAGARSRPRESAAVAGAQAHARDDQEGVTPCCV